MIGKKLAMLEQNLTASCQVEDVLNFLQRLNLQSAPSFNGIFPLILLKMLEEKSGNLGSNLAPKRGPTLRTFVGKYVSCNQFIMLHTRKRKKSSTAKLFSYFKWGLFISFYIGFDL